MLILPRHDGHDRDMAISECDAIAIDIGQVKGQLSRTQNRLRDEQPNEKALKKTRLHG
jgi:hypothetical protein